jgi:hypothetical protein
MLCTHSLVGSIDPSVATHISQVPISLHKVALKAMSTHVCANFHPVLLRQLDTCTGLDEMSIPRIWPAMPVNRLSGLIPTSTL